MVKLYKPQRWGVAGYMSGRILGKTEADKQQLAITLGRAAMGMKLLDTLLLELSEEYNTVNYKLYRNGLCIYTGICFEDRLDKRLSEHKCKGLIFDDYSYDKPKGRKRALQKEYNMIRRNRPKHNIQHNG